MKKIITLLVFISSVLYISKTNAQEILTPLTACDTGNGTAEFNLFVAFSEALSVSGISNPSEYTFGFFETESDAQNNVNPVLTGLNNYTNSSIPQNFYFRFENNDTSDVTIYTVELIVNPLPAIGQPFNLYDLSGTFDLTANINVILNGNTDYSLSFHQTQEDAESGSNPVLSPESYMLEEETYGTIYARVTDNLSGCANITSFSVYIPAGDLSIPSYLQVNTCDDNSDGQAIYDLESVIPQILGSLNPAQHTISFHVLEEDAQNNTNPIADPGSYLAGGLNPDNVQLGVNVSIWTVYARVEDNVSGGVGYAKIFVSVKRKPIIYPIPDLVIYQDVYTGTASFNLQQEISNSGYISIPGGEGMLSTHFYLTETDALNGVNPITLSGGTNYTNITNPQTVYISSVNVSDGIEDCEPTISSFVIKVEEGPEPVVYIPDTNFKARLLAASPENYIAIADLAPGSNGITIDINGDGEIQLSEAKAVKVLHVSDSNISDLTGINSFTNLRLLHAYNNTITDLNLTDLLFLYFIEAQNNPLAELELVDLHNLFVLNVSNTELTQLDFSKVRNDDILGASVSGGGIILSSIIMCFNNENLTTVNLKNGSAINRFTLALAESQSTVNSTGLELVCVDDFNVQAYSAAIYFFENTETVLINPYCSYEPGGDYYNTLTGEVRFDFDQTGCDENDSGTYLTKIVVDNGTEQNAVFTNQAGEYNFYTQTGNFILTPEVDNPEFFSISPVSTSVDFPVVDNYVATNNFCITPNGVHPDVEVVIAPIIPARPGFDAVYRVVYRNKGNQLISGSIDFEFDDTRLDFVASNPAASTQSTGQLTYDFMDLVPFESRAIRVTLNVNSPQEVPAVNIDDILPFTAEITINQTDESPEDNIFEFNQIVVGAYDPNDIACIEGDVVHPDYIGEKLHYLIRFENTGNYYAENVVVAMEIDTEKYDIDSVRLLNTSHSADAQVKDGILEIFFNQIYLDSGGHGNILLVMKSVNTLSEGDSVQSKADIYFDYNYPIITNDAVTAFEATMSVLENTMLDIVKIYPNPTTDFVSISSTENIRSFELFDMTGKLIRVGLINSFETKIDLTSQNKGIYFLKINTDSGSLARKIVRD